MDFGFVRCLALVALCAACGDDDDGTLPDAQPMFDSAMVGPVSLRIETPSQGTTVADEFAIELDADPREALTRVTLFADDVELDTIDVEEDDPLAFDVDIGDHDDGPVVLRADSFYVDGRHGTARSSVILENRRPGARIVAPAIDEAFFVEDGEFDVDIAIGDSSLIRKVALFVEDAEVFRVTGPSREVLSARVDPRPHLPEVDRLNPGAFAPTLTLRLVVEDESGRTNTRERRIRFATRLRWTFAAAGVIESPPAAVPGGVAFGTLLGEVFVVNADGTRRCLFNAADGSEQVLSGPVPSPDGARMVVGTTRHLRALTTEGCVVLWNFAPIAQWLGEPAISPVDGTTVAATFDGTLHGINTAGVGIWALDLSTLLAPPGGTVQIEGGATVGPDGTAYQGATLTTSSQRGLFAAVGTTGASVFAFEGPSFRGGITVSNGRVYSGSSDGRLYAFDAVTGMRTFPAEPLLDEGRPVLCTPRPLPDGHLAICERGGLVHSVDLASGDLDWTYDVATASDEPVGSINRGGMTVGPDGTLYVGDVLGVLHALDASGEVRWTFRALGEIRGRPAVSDSLVYIGSADLRLYALSTAPRPE